MLNAVWLAYCTEAYRPLLRDEPVRFVVIPLLVTYHFAAQHFGAPSLYRSRAERAGCVHTRRLDRIFALGLGGALVLLAEILAGSAAYQDLWVDRWPVFDWLVSNQEGISEAALLILFVATILMLVAEARAPRRRACFTSWGPQRWSPSLCRTGACFSSSCSGRHSIGSLQRDSLP